MTTRLLPMARLRTAVLVLVVGGGAAGLWWSRPAGPLPEALSDEAFWALIEDLSETGGYFQSDNLVSNEHSYQYVVPALEQLRGAGQAYLGVAPDQNFTYILALQPRIAFIVDIRRGNLLTHLLYKSIFELSPDRADFLSWLFSRPRPAGLPPEASIDDLLAAFSRVRPDELAFRDNLLTLQHHLTRTKGFDLTADDLREFDRIYSEFFTWGPDLSYSTRAGNPRAGLGRGRRFSRFPTWGQMVAATDASGVHRGYLADESAFLAIKALQERNLIIPVVGDHTGPTALRAVGRYLARHRASVGAFYTSNVEQYLFRYGTWDRFAQNLEALPVTDTAVIIRSVAPRDGYVGLPQGPDGRATVLDPIAALLDDVADGRVSRYRDVAGRVR